MKAQTNFDEGNGWLGITLFEMNNIGIEIIPESLK